MPIFRPEVRALNPYVAGRPIEEVVREYGGDASDVIKLASNESPEGPFPGVAEAIVEAVALSNRYPDNDAWDLVAALSSELGVDGSSILLGNGSVALITDSLLAVGGPGTNVVYGWPSFIMYRLSAAIAGSAARELPLDSDLALDLGAIAAAVDSDTRAVFVCNPNNPTGTVVAGADLEEFVEAMPESVLVVVDEAYHEYVDAPDYRSMIAMAPDRPNLMVLRTFSKIFSLAAHRIGYAVCHPDTAAGIRKIQSPFAVSRVAQAAATASLGQPGEVARRAAENAAGRHYLFGALQERGLRAVESQTNFVFFRGPGENSEPVGEELIRRGVIVRPMSGGWLRVTVGFGAENRRFIESLDDVMSTSQY